MVLVTKKNRQPMIETNTHIVHMILKMSRSLRAILGIPWLEEARIVFKLARLMLFNRLGDW